MAIIRPPKPQPPIHARNRLLSTPDKEFKQRSVRELVEADGKKKLKQAVISDPPRPDPVSITRKLALRRRLLLEPQGRVLRDPSEYTLHRMYNVDGANSADGQLTNMSGTYTNPRIDGLAWSDDGKLITITNMGDDNIKTFECSVAFDPSTASSSPNATMSVTNAVGLGFSQDGDYMWSQRATDTVSVWQCTTPWTTPTTNTPSSAEAKGGDAFSFNASADGPVFIALDGLSMWWFAGDTDDQYIRYRTMSVAWDLDTLSTTGFEQSDSLFIGNGGNVSQGMWASNDGKTLVFLGANGGNSAIYTMETGGDIANATRGPLDGTTYDDFSGLKDGDGCYIDSRGYIWRWASGDANMDLGVWQPTT